MEERKVRQQKSENNIEMLSLSEMSGHQFFEARPRPFTAQNLKKNSRPKNLPDEFVPELARFFIEQGSKEIPVRSSLVTTMSKIV